MTADEQPNAKLPAPTSRWVSTLVFGTIIFACGAAAGVAVGMRLDDDGDAWRKQAGEKRPYAERMTTHLTEELDLTADQAKQVHSILERHTQYFRDIHATISPKLKTQMDCLRDEVGECLDERQRGLWEEKVERLRKRTQSHI